jgi:hypothetical protein
MSKIPSSAQRSREPHRLGCTAGRNTHRPSPSLMDLIVASSVALVLIGCGPWKSLPRTSPLTPNGSDSLAVMDFAQPISLDPISDGWYHRTFSTSDPMEISFVEKDGRPSVRLATHDSASMLFRFVDIPLDDYPMLQWQWLIEKAIETELDERTGDGDDHPARLFLRFESADGDEHKMEIIWGNEHLGAGEWLHLSYLGGLYSFPHYVANGRAENVGRWHAEEVDLAALFRELWDDPAGARLVSVALFCDTDGTGAESIAYFSDVRVARRN